MRTSRRHERLHALITPESRSLNRNTQPTSEPSPPTFAWNASNLSPADRLPSCSHMQNDVAEHQWRSFSADTDLCVTARARPMWKADTYDRDHDSSVAWSAVAIFDVLAVRRNPRGRTYRDKAMASVSCTVCCV